MRDYNLGSTFDVKFTTRQATGAPFTLAGTPVISAYVGNDVTQLTAGITLSVDFDGVTGLNNVRVVATSGNGYATASNYALVITTGTVNSVSVVGEVVAEFSLEAQSPLRPTVAARTVDVDASGGVEVGSFQANAITAAAIADGAIDAATFAAGAIDAAAIAANAIGASELAADVITDIWQGTALTESYATDGAAATPAQLLYMIWSALAEFSIATTTITAKKLDGATTAMTFTLDDGTNPTSRTRAS